VHQIKVFGRGGDVGDAGAGPRQLGVRGERFQCIDDVEHLPPVVGLHGVGLQDPADQPVPLDPDLYVDRPQRHPYEGSGEPADRRQIDPRLEVQGRGKA
jgi:hypothetical protein